MRCDDEAIEASGYVPIRTRQFVTLDLRFLFDVGVSLAGMSAAARFRSRPGESSNPIFDLTSTPVAGLVFGTNGGDNADQHFVDLTVSSAALGALAPLRHGAFQLLIVSGGETAYAFHCDDWEHKAGAYA